MKGSNVEEKSKLVEEFVNSALKLASSGEVVLGDSRLWDDVDRDTLVDVVRVQSALLRARTIELDGWSEAMCLVSELSTKHDESAYNEASALLSTRLGTGKELTMLTMVVLGLDGWRAKHAKGTSGEDGSGGASD